MLTKATLTADAGYASEANMRHVFDAGIDAYIADTQFRKRDPRFKGRPTAIRGARAKTTGTRACFARGLHLRRDRAHLYLSCRQAAL